MSPFLILLVLVSACAPAAVDDDGSGNAGNRTDVKSGRGGDAGDNGLADVGARDRTDAGSGCGVDNRDDGSAVMGGDNGPVVVEDGLAAEDDGSVAGDDGSAVDDDASAANQADAGPGNEPDADLIMTITGNIRADLMKDFNNGVPLVVSDKLSHIVPDKHVIDSSAQILANVINNLFGNLSPLLMALPSSLLLPSLPTSTTGNFGNISTTFIYYMLICIQDLIFS